MKIEVQTFQKKPNLFFYKVSFVLPLMTNIQSKTNSQTFFCEFYYLMKAIYLVYIDTIDS